MTYTTGVGSTITLVPTSSGGYVLDTRSGAVLNNDVDGWARYEAERQRALEFEQMKVQIAVLQQAVEELKKKIEEK